MKRLAWLLLIASAGLFAAAPAFAAGPTLEQDIVYDNCAGSRTGTGSSGQAWAGDLDGAFEVSQAVHECNVTSSGVRQFRAILFASKDDAVILTVSTPSGAVLGAVTGTVKGQVNYLVCVPKAELGYYTVHLAGTGDRLILSIVAGGSYSPCVSA